MFGSRSSLAGWCLVAALSFPFALVVGLNGRMGLPRPVPAIIVVSLVLMVLRMGAWFVFQKNWRKAERLRQARANRRLTAIAASCQEMLWETRGERFVYLAPTVMAYLGYEPEELLGKSSLTILADVEHERAVKMARTSSLAACGWKDEEYTFKAKNGELRDFLSSGLAQTDEDGKVVGFAGSLRGLDGLSERQQANRVQHQIQQVIDEGSMTTVFQPIIDTNSALAVGAEALSRFPLARPTLETDKWFAAAHRVGLGTALELNSIRQAIAAAAESLPNGLFLSVNISPATLLTGALNDVIHDSGWNPACLVVEITEHVGVEDYEALTAQTEDLRRRGLRLAVDDAGAGYSSFRHILALRPDYIKLDRGLIAGIDSDPGKRALVKAVTSFAGDIGATVIAEGIETEQELHAATALGAQGAQGFFIAVPSPISDWPEAHRSGPAIIVPSHAESLHA